MSRKTRTPEENERRAKIRELLQMGGISSMDDIQNLFKETIGEFMENGLNAEPDDEPGYRRYDYRNKDTDNSRNGHSSKTLRTGFGDVEVSVPRARKGEFEPQLLKKNQTSISLDIEEKILSMYAKGMTTSGMPQSMRLLLWMLWTPFLNAGTENTPKSLNLGVTTGRILAHTSSTRRKYGGLSIPLMPLRASIASSGK